MAESMSRERKKANRKKDRPFEPKGFSGTIYVLLHDVTCMLAVITLLFVFAARLVGVSGQSMYPTLVGGVNETERSGDYLVLESNFLKSSFDCGDIVVACVPQFQNGKPIVKRVIATGGQTVDFQRDTAGVIHVCVDGRMLEEPYIYQPMDADKIPSGSYPAKVPEGSYFLLGDNRNNSTDSRVIGFVDGRYIVGKAILVAMPGQDFTGGNGSRDWSRIGNVYAN